MTTQKSAVLKYIKPGMYSKHIWISSPAVNKETYDTLSKLAEKLERLYPNEFICARMNVDIKTNDCSIVVQASHELKKKMTLEKYATYKVLYEVNLLKLSNDKTRVVINITDALLLSHDNVVVEKFEW